jgi:hypothetical protein
MLLNKDLVSRPETSNRDLSCPNLLRVIYFIIGLEILGAFQ